MRAVPEGYAYLSATLKQALAEMPDDGRALARECFQHWAGEFERLGKDGAEPARIAVTAHWIVDARMKDLLATTENGRAVKCAKGCAACCHLHVGISPLEAELLCQVAEAEGIEIDLARLARQAPKDDETWHELAPEDRACVFLGPDRTCRVYEHRPGACRKYTVRSDPDLCDMSKHPGGRVAIVFSMEAEIVHSAAMTVQGFGNMATMLLTATKDKT